jgi:1-acyl-sn-glycerol-3-phosphate acyltransferase
MLAVGILLPLAILWITFAWICNSLTGALRGDVPADLAWGLSQIYVRVLHRLRVVGLDNIARIQARSGPLILVSNHTAGVDPVLLQSICPFEVRWMMMRTMMKPALQDLWAWLGVIPVEQNGRDSQALRTALRHLKDGGILGIFAEGGIERPPQTITPYEAGVGLLVLKTGARVLPVVIRGTPQSNSALASLISPSHAVVEFLPIKDYSTSNLTAEAIALDLELQAARTLNWPRGPRRGPG